MSDKDRAMREDNMRSQQQKTIQPTYHGSAATRKTRLSMFFLVGHDEMVFRAVKGSAGDQRKLFEKEKKNVKK